MPNPMQSSDPLRSEGDGNLTPRRAAWAAARIGPETKALLEEDARHFLHQSLSTPCLNALRSAAGASITDIEGRTFLDFHGNNVHQVGYGHPKVIAAVKAQLDTLPFCPRRYTNEPVVALAKRLTELAPPGLTRVLFAPGGAEAMGMALKLARAATGRFKTISMWESFHGASLDCISLGGEAIFRHDAGPLLPGCEHAPPPDPTGCPFKCGRVCNAACADYVEYMLEKEGDVAAVVAETVRSTPLFPPVEYWQRIRAACDRHGALLILDEIPTCLGRTGTFYACEHYGIVPDMLVIGKGLGGGVFPMAALLAREELNVAGEKALGHYTHEKSPVGAAAALAAIEVLVDDGVMEQSRRLGEHALAALTALKRKHPLIGDVRGRGLMLGVELLRPGSGERACDEAEAILYAALSRGLSFKLTMGNILFLTPALTITRDEMDRAIQILDACFEELSAS